MIKELSRYKEFLKSNVKKDIRGKYKGSFLGILWSFVNPLLSVLVYAIIFPIILSDSPENYVTYLVVGIIPWTFFTTVISQGTSVILLNSGIVKKVYFPREILPISVATSGLVNFLISSLVIVVFLIFSGIGFSWYILFFPLIALLQYIICLGIILITGAINVYIRDLEYIVNFFVSMLFYATPILYTIEAFPASLHWIHKVNPMAVIINSYRDILFYQQMPDWTSVLIMFGVGLLLVFFGMKIFHKLEKGFAEEL